MKKFIKDPSTGKKYAVWFDFKEKIIMWKGGWFAPVPCCKEDSNYTDGDVVWQKACDLFWELERKNVNKSN